MWTPVAASGVQPGGGSSAAWLRKRIKNLAGGEGGVGDPGR